MVDGGAMAAESGSGSGTASGVGEVDEASTLVRTFGWEDMFLPPEEDPRDQGATFDNERDTLVGYLRDYRLTIEMKCAGLDAEQMARRSVPPSSLSLLGLVRHLANVEQYWFRRVLGGQDVPRIYTREADFDGAVADPEVVEAAWAGWREEVRHSERFVEEAPNLEVFGVVGDGQVSLREVLVHMIEEYARHAGHADLLRERVDGRVGQ
jgi:uncharacterized damage-inducible protein DinB